MGLINQTLSLFDTVALTSFLYSSLLVVVLVVVQNLCFNQIVTIQLFLLLSCTWKFADLCETCNICSNKFVFFS